MVANALPLRHRSQRIKRREGKRKRIRVLLILIFGGKLKEGYPNVLEGIQFICLLSPFFSYINHKIL